MLFMSHISGENAATRPAPGFIAIVMPLAPAFLVVVVLFGGGLLLGMAQALGYFPGTDDAVLTSKHLRQVLSDPDFLYSAGLTCYIAVTSTAIAALLSIGVAIGLLTLSERLRWVHFVVQIPLVIPHVVAAIAMIFLLAPTGLFSRVMQNIGLIQGASDFPLFVNDRFCVGILAAYVWKEIPFITLMLLSALRNAGTQFEEVGKTLKANRWQRFRYITLPIILPSLLASILIVFAYTFGAFEIPYLLGQTYPMLLPVWAYKNYADIDLMARPEGIALGMLIAGFIVCVMAIAQLISRSSGERG